MPRRRSAGWWRPSRPSDARVHPSGWWGVGGLRAVLGIGALFSGVALLTNILAGVSLLLSLGVATLAFVLVGVVVLLRASSPERSRTVEVALIGLGSGLLATFAYDTTKAILSQLDSSPYDPFEALRVFGRLLIGESAARDEVFAVGAAYHLLNGLTFGLAFTFLLGRDGATSRRFAFLSGVLWGVFLELFQLTLYPGWLDIRAYQEFVQISAASHLVFGTVLGLTARSVMRRRFAEGHA